MNSKLSYFIISFLATIILSAIGYRLRHTTSEVETYICIVIFIGLPLLIWIDFNMKDDE